MKRSTIGGLVACTAALLSNAARQAEARVFVASATGQVADTSQPLNGTGDIAGSAGDLLQMMLNADDSDPLGIVDRRGVFEIDVSELLNRAYTRALLQFDVVGANSPFEVNIFLFAGDGIVSPDDYGRTDNLAFSGILVDDKPLIDVTGTVEQMVDGGDTWIGVLIAMTHEDQTLAIDNVDGQGIDPSITTKGVPEPTTLALLASFPISLALRRRSRRSF